MPCVECRNAEYIPAFYTAFFHSTEGPEVRGRRYGLIIQPGFPNIIKQDVFKNFKIFQLKINYRRTKA